MPEVNLRVIPQLLFILFFETWLSLTLGVSNLAKLASQQAPGIHLPLHPQCWDCKHTPPHTSNS